MAQRIRLVKRKNASLGNGYSVPLRSYDHQGSVEMARGIAKLNERMSGAPRKEKRSLRRELAHLQAMLGCRVGRPVAKRIFAKIREEVNHGAAEKRAHVTAQRIHALLAELSVNI